MKILPEVSGFRNYILLKLQIPIECLKRSFPESQGFAWCITLCNLYNLYEIYLGFREQIKRYIYNYPVNVSIDAIS